MTRIIKVIICLGLWASTAECARILFFICRLAKSHQIVFHPIIRELAARGHEVDFYTHHPMSNPPKTLNQIPFAIEDFHVKMKRSENLKAMQAFRTLHQVIRVFRSQYYGESKSCYTAPQVKELLASNRSYDMVMGEFVLMQEEFSYLMHKFNALGVMLQSFPDHHWLGELSGLPDNPAYMVPAVTNYTDKMNFVERLWNFFETVTVKLYDYYCVLTQSQEIADKHLRYEGWESRPPVIKMVSDMALILISAHHSLGYSYPRAPHVKEVLGTHVLEKPPPLSKDLQEFMDTAEHGVVYFSLGSITSVQLLKSAHAYEPILKVLSGLKQKVLWKWTSWSGEDKPPEVPNIKFMKWIPQQSVLAHNNTKLFIAHGGFGGLTETVCHGVPIIGFPVFADQQKNVRLAVKLGLGLELHLETVTDASLKSAVDEILYNPKYKEAAMRRSAIFKDRPMKPVDEAVYWIEYVLRYGKVLQPAAAQMPFYQLYLFDVIGFLAVCTIIALLILLRLVRVVGRAMRMTVLRLMCTVREDSNEELKKNE